MNNSREGWDTFRKEVANFPPLEQLWSYVLSLDEQFPLPTAGFVESMEEEPETSGWQVLWDSPHRDQVIWFDLYPDGRFEYFYRNREIEELHCEPEGPLPTLGAIPEEVTELLKRFVNAEKEGPTPPG